ncbi:MAG: DUF4129 domain-containing protein [Armatimonadetes bacterium]|nr:DUF4129 domain-containing protein [Armatimonadota bacterium]
MRKFPIFLVIVLLCSIAIGQSVEAQPKKIDISSEFSRMQNPSKSGNIENPQKAVTAIKKQPEYRSSTERQGRNWFSSALQRIGEAIDDFLGRLFKRPEQEPRNNGGIFPESIGIFIIYFVITILAALLIWFLIWAISKVRFAKAARIGRLTGNSSILEEDEPDRTADEWLKRADELEAQGEYRLAVRCLYLACLVRLDENLVAQFRRHETNWEHLARIMTSQKRPPNFQFLPPTRLFDLVWYGNQGRGQADVSEMREFYKGMMADLTGRQIA